MKRSLLLVSLVLVVGTGCEKSKSSSGTPSGAPSGDESSMLKHVPKGNKALFGGSFSKFQDFMKGSVFTELMGLAGQDAPGLKVWTDCFTGYKIVMVGGMSGSTAALEMQYVMKGITAQQIAACGKKASFATTVDPDGKFVVVETPTAAGPTKVGYLQIADGLVFNRTNVQMGGTPAPAERAAMEAAQASLASGTAADDTELTSLMKKVDRSRAVWFVASASGTSLADKVRSGWGWLDAGTGLSFDMSVELAQQALADEVAKSIPQLKQSADMLGSEVGAVVKGLRFDQSGKTLHFGLEVSEAQLKAMLEKLKPMMGGGLGGPARMGGMAEEP